MKVDSDTMIVDAGGARRKVSAALLKDLCPGDYVMIHAGAAISKITESDSDESDALWEQFR